MSKAKKITISIISIFLVLVLIAIGVYYLWPWNKSFFDKATKEFSIPGLDTTFVPQGFTTIDDDTYLFSGYMSDGSTSRFYVVEEDGTSKYFTLDINGKDYDGHAGGVEITGSSVWVVGDGMAIRFLLSDILNVKSGNKIYAKSHFEPLNGADFVFTNEGILWIGEFYREGNYDTRSHHKITTSSGEINTAVVFGYELDDSNKTGLSSKIPVKALSIRGLCQGMAVTDDGKFVLSTSYSIADSNLYYYNNVLENVKDSTINYDKHIIPLWYLDSENLISTLNAPSMAEEIVIKNNRVYISFESNCKKYRLFNRKRLKNVYSISINDL